MRKGIRFTGYAGAADVGGLGDYIPHHNAPQYFGCVAANTTLNQNLQSYNQFFADMDNKNLGSSGVFYIKGGFQNQYGLTPLNTAELRIDSRQRDHETPTMG